MSLNFRELLNARQDTIDSTNKLYFDKYNVTDYNDQIVKFFEEPFTKLGEIIKDAGFENDTYLFKGIAEELLKRKAVVPAGSILAGITSKRSNTSFSNCYIGGPVHHERIKTAIHQALSDVPNTAEKGRLITGLMDFVKEDPFGHVWLAYSEKVDSMDYIVQQAHLQAKTFKARGGYGANLSVYAPNDVIHTYEDTIDSEHKRSGPCSYLNLYNYMSEIVTQGGNRRAALMQCLHARHPDVLEFMSIKETKKLNSWSIKARISDSTSLVDILKESITDQEIITKLRMRISKHIEEGGADVVDTNPISNANLSVMLPTKFITALKEDAEWQMYYPDHKKLKAETGIIWDGNYAVLEYIFERAGADLTPYMLYKKSMKAREFFDILVANAHKKGDPGILFEDSLNAGIIAKFEKANHPKIANGLVYEELGCNWYSATNPCGEIPGRSFDNCLLSSINLAGIAEATSNDRISPEYGFQRNNYVVNKILDIAHHFGVSTEKMNPLVMHNGRTTMAIFLSAFTGTLLLNYARKLNIETNRHPNSLYTVFDLLSNKIGLGITGFSDYMLMNGFTQDKLHTEEAQDFIEATMEVIKLGDELAQRILIKDVSDKRFIFTPSKIGNVDFRKAGIPVIINDKENGRYNNYSISIAPTGTLSMLIGNVSSGIEPNFATIQERRIKGKDDNGKDHEYTVRIINNSIANQVIAAAYEDMEGTAMEVLEDLVDRMRSENCPDSNAITDALEEIVEIEDKGVDYDEIWDYYVSRAEEDFYEGNSDDCWGHVREIMHYYPEKFAEYVEKDYLPAYQKLCPTMATLDHKTKLIYLATLQKHVDQSISNTLNLAKGTSRQTVEDIILNSLEMGLKGITVYVDGTYENQAVSEVTLSQGLCPKCAENGKEVPLKRFNGCTECTECDYSVCM